MFEQWWQAPAGTRAQAWLQATLPAFLQDCFGFYAIQLATVTTDFLHAARVRWRWRLGAGDGAIPCHFEQLPLASASIDAVLALFTWSLSEDPFATLREIERVLVPEGRLIVVGFNPWAGRAVPPTLAKVSAPRLREHLRVLGFETRGGRFGVYTPARAANPWPRWELAMARWLPMLGQVYLVEAIKRVTAVRVIVPDWRTRLSLRAARLTNANGAPAPKSHKEHPSR